MEINFDQFYRFFILCYNLKTFSLYYYTKDRYKSKFTFFENYSFEILDCEFSFKNGFFNIFVEYVLSFKNDLGNKLWFNAYFSRLVFVLMVTDESNKEFKVNELLLENIKFELGGLIEANLIEFQDEKLKIVNCGILTKENRQALIKILHKEMKNYTSDESFYSNIELKNEKTLGQLFSLLEAYFPLKEDIGEEEGYDDEDSYDSADFDEDYDEFGLGSKKKFKRQEEVFGGQNQINSKENTKNFVLKIEVINNFGDDSGYEKDILNIQKEKARRLYSRAILKKFLTKNNINLKRYKQNTITSYNPKADEDMLEVNNITRNLNNRIIISCEKHNLDFVRGLGEFMKLKVTLNVSNDNYVKFLGRIFTLQKKLLKDFSEVNFLFF